MACFVRSSLQHPPPLSPPSAARSLATTQLAEGYTDEALASKYDNHKGSRPGSQLSGTSLGSTRAFLSTYSLSKLDTIDESLLDEMLAGQSRRVSIVDDSFYVQRNSIAVPNANATLFVRARDIYERYGGRHIGPFVVLFCYSLLGALFFYYIEHDHEIQLKKKEQQALDDLRNGTLSQLRLVIQQKLGATTARDILLEHEKNYLLTRLPESMEWDYLGALYYVGTIYTTIGYGNIVARTASGRLLTVGYALIGIPLVLAILSQFGRYLTLRVSEMWQRHRQQIRQAKHATAHKLGVTRLKMPLGVLESGTMHQTLEDTIEIDESGDVESKTIPIWLALLICLLWMCSCAALFLLWEKNWSFFTSLYFIFISLSTIGLGDVVPDHPHLLIVTFFLVIIGLSIVSMLLSVIQIKMEEWLYSLMVKMQKEYQRALDEGKPFERDAIMQKMMEKEPWFMRNLAPNLISHQQNEKLEKQAETYEMLVKETNSKQIQTETMHAHGTTQVELAADTIGCDPMSDVNEKKQAHTQWSTQQRTIPPLNSIDDERQDSVSDATSLPLDSFSVAEHGKDGKKVQTFDEEVQTDIAQFQLDMIVLQLAKLQKPPPQRRRPPLVDCSTDTSIALAHDRSLQCDVLSQADKAIITEVLNVMSRSMETDALQKAIQTTACGDDSIAKFVDRSVAMSPRSSFACRSLQTSFDADANFDTTSMQTSLHVANCATSPLPTPVMSLKRNVDRNTSPVVLPHSSVARSQQTSPSIRRDDHDETSEIMGVSSVSGHGTSHMAHSMNGHLHGHLGREFSQLAPPRARSCSTSGVGNSVFDEDNRQDVIIQTEDSYLKIARRLDEYRNNKTQFLPVCAASPVSSAPMESDRPSERRGFFLDAPMRKLSKRKMARRERHENDEIDELTEEETIKRTCSVSYRSQSCVPHPLQRKSSLPLGCTRGKVMDYIEKHERGYASPATMRRTTIVRQYSLEQ